MNKNPLRSAEDTFYLVTEKLDLIMMVYAQQKHLSEDRRMGTNGVGELIILCSLVHKAGLPVYHLPEEPRLFFEALINPQYVKLKRGGIYRAYWALRNYLIEHKDKFDYDRMTLEDKYIMENKG